jgi:hypothetical protein
VRWQTQHKPEPTVTGPNGQLVSLCLQTLSIVTYFEQKAFRNSAGFRPQVKLCRPAAHLAVLERVKLSQKLISLLSSCAVSRLTNSLWGLLSGSSDSNSNKFYKVRFELRKARSLQQTRPRPAFAWLPTQNDKNESKISHDALLTNNARSRRTSGYAQHTVTFRPAGVSRYFCFACIVMFLCPSVRLSELPGGWTRSCARCTPPPQSLLPTVLRPSER